MPNIALKFKDQELETYPIQIGQKMTIGRKPENDIVIDNLAVSGSHAAIEGTGDGFLLLDLQSKNGTFVNEKAITSHRLAHGDLVTIGKHQLSFTYAEDEKQPAEITNDLFETMVMDTDEHRNMLNKNKKESAEAASNSQPTAALSLLAGGQGEIVISKKLFKIGKSPQSDHKIKGFFTGQTAVTISQRPSGYYLSYASGLAKPKVNGKTVITSILLKEFDIIEIGKEKMQLVLKK